MSYGSNRSQKQCEKMKPCYFEGSVAQLHSSSSPGSNSSISQAGHHEHEVHEDHLRPLHEENLQKVVGEPSPQQMQFSDDTSPRVDMEHGKQYMLDISSDISENLSFYIDGKIVSTSTVSSCEAVEVNPGSSALVGLDALMLDPAQISQVFNTDSAIGKEIPGQSLIKRRTATPPLLPQIKTELESEVVVSSSASGLASSLIENRLPQNTESVVVQKERTVFLSPKLKQLLEKQDGLKPTLALLSESQTQCSPVSLSVLPHGAARFKRRTGSPQHNTSSNDRPPTLDSGEFDISMEHQQNSPESEDDVMISVVEPMVKPVLTENWPQVVGGNPCNQQPLDLSNTFKRSEDLDSDDAALDLSFQKTSLIAPELTDLNHLELGTHLMEKALLQCANESNLSLVSPGASLLTDLTIVTGSDLVSPVDPGASGLVYGLTLPNSALTPASAALTPLALTPASTCTIAFASSAPHTMLPTTPSLITVLASPTQPPLLSCSSATSQPIQVLAPGLSSEPMVICTNNVLSSSDCDLANTFAASNPANLIALEPSLNLPSHVFLSDPITLNPPILESASMSEAPFTPTVTLSDPLFNSYNIASNTVLIECTIALEAPGSSVPASIALQHNTSESPAQTQMQVSHIEQQHIMSVTSPQTVDPTVLVSSTAEPVTMSSSTAEVSESGTVCKSSTSSDPEPVDNSKPLPIKVEEAPNDSVCLSETSSPPFEEEEEPINKTAPDTQQQAFTKNFICNVCDKLFHSMKELGDHIGDHSDEWPYKCEFCMLLFCKPCALLEHRSNLHGVGKTYVCQACTKEFVYLCNLKQHQEELHPGQQCTYSEEEKGKLRPQNYNNSTKVSADTLVSKAPEERELKKEDGEVDVAAEELFTTIKVMASDIGKTKGPDVRLGINQHYPSFKPPPFPYHNRSPAGFVASATNFTTHNIPQTFSTAIRCTKCGKSFDNMPELHKHILVCANASDKRRYTPRKNPIPLRHFAKAQNGVLLSTNPANGFNTSIKIKVSQSNRSEAHQEASIRYRVSRKKKKLVQRVMPQRLKSASSSTKVKVSEQQDIFVCPHCRREFTRGRSRTKHMAVCHKKPREVKRRKPGMVSVTKENDRHFHRGAKGKRPSSPQHKTRLQTSGSAKRPSSILPQQTTFSSKRCKILIKESPQPKQETDTLSELPIVCTFNPAMHQYRRTQHNKGAPVKFTAMKAQRDQQTHTREDASDAEHSV
ncbi:PR domain zinc finger protein 2 [Gouania willdenowi]|uniref:PR domain zinc finger protein 2-like n=1 Tax=Gouania willdenowi TaxID=441366 RepID=A0A8C5DDX6_GOUWI|nr:PR domain zinc finger protein 2-like [Gouania willdenowi]